MNTRADRGGFTLVEMLLAMVILAIVMSGVMGLVVSVQRSYGQQRQAVRFDETLRAAQLIITTGMRAAGADPHRLGTPGLDPDPLGHGATGGAFDNVRALSDFNPADGDTSDPLEDLEVWLSGDSLMIRWQEAATPQAAAIGVDSLRIAYFAIDGTALTTAATAASATRARITITTTPDPRDGRVGRVETWIYLRNSN